MDTMMFFGHSHINSPQNFRELFKFIKTDNCVLKIHLKRHLTHSPNIHMKTPPTIGSGIVAKRAPNLPATPKTIIISALKVATRLLPT